MSSIRWMCAALCAALLLGVAPATATQPLPRVGVRPGDPFAEFYTVRSGARFVPDGFSYTVLDPGGRATTAPYAQTYAHVTFDSGFYDPAAADSVLSGIANAGFNVVRVIVDSGDDVHQRRGIYGIEGPDESRGLYRPVVDNLIDFLRRAREHRVYVIVALHAYPENQGFKNIVQAGSLPHVTGTSQYYLSPGGIRAKAEYVRELVGDVAATDDGSLLSTVLAWEIQVEMFVSDQAQPFSMRSGTVTTADGKTYNMGDPASRQDCMDSNFVNWANVVSAAVRSRDPQALVTAGFATYYAVHKAGPNGLIRVSGTDQRYPPRPLAFIRAHALSFIDMHAYPKRDNPPYTLARALGSSEFPQWDLRSTPVLLGEYGVNKRQFPDMSVAQSVAREEQHQAFALGLAGTVYWTWNTPQPGWWAATQDGGAILRVLLRP